MNDIAELREYVRKGGTLAVPSATRWIVIDEKCWMKWDKAGLELLKPEGNGYRLRMGRGSVYLFAGQLKRMG